MNTSPAATDFTMSDHHITSEWDKICGIVPEEPLSWISKADGNEMLQEWTSGVDSDFNIMDIDEQIGSDFFADSIFKDEPPQEQLDFMDFDLERVDNFTFTGSPVSPQDSPLINDNYLEGIQRLTELMQHSQETRLLLKLKYQHESSKMLKKIKGKATGAPSSSTRSMHYHAR